MSASARASGKDQVPDWVREAAAQKLPTYPALTKAVVLLDDHTYTVAADGTRTEHVRRVVRILRPQGRDFGTLYAHVSNAEKLKFVHLWGIGPDGHEHAVKDNEQTEVSVGASFELYTDDRARGGSVPALGPGTVAAIEYQVQDRPFENDIIWIPSESIPVLKERLTISLPDGFQQKSSWKGQASAKPVDLEKNRTLWEVTDLPALEHEDLELAPGELSLAARLDVFYYAPGAVGPQTLRGDWKDIGLWFEALARDRNKPDPAITAKAQELVAGKTGFREQVEAISSFVQSGIRYVAIEIGVGGYQPHPAADIFRYRYGDCKDKATLLSAMLSSVGIRSTWVLVDVERGMAKEAPSIYGDHMIGAIELPGSYKPEGMYSIVNTSGGKRFLLFDPTWEKTPFGHIEHELQGTDALLVDGPASQVIHIPMLDPAQNRLERRATFKLAEDGGISGSIHEQRIGDMARQRRYLFTEANGKQQTEFFEHLLSRDLLSFQLSQMKPDNVRDLSKDFTLDYSLQVPHFAQQAGPLLMVRPRVLGSETFALDRPGARRNGIPIQLGSTRSIHDLDDLEMPAGYTVDELPPPTDLDLGFASYNSHVTVSGQTLHYDRTYTVREMTIPAERYGDVEKLARTIAADEQNTAVLKRQP